MAGGLRPVIHASNRNVDCYSGWHTAAASDATTMTDAAKAWTPSDLIDLQIFNETDGSSGIITDNDATSVTVAALAGGTQNDWDQNDRYEINNSQLVITSGIAAATSDGTIISQASWGANDKFSSSGGGDGRLAEIILQQNQTYVRRFLSGGADNIVQFRASWYEHTNR